MSEIRAKYVAIHHASAQNVEERWHASYCRDGKWRPTAMGDTKRVYDALCALGPNPPIDKVAEAIGNKSWSYLSCDGCSDYVERAVAIGEYEPKTYCATCITEAARVLGASDA